MEICRLDWLAGLAGWQGLAGQRVNGSETPTLAFYIDVYRLGRAGLAGWEGSAGQEVIGSKTAKR